MVPAVPVLNGTGVTADVANPATAPLITLFASDDDIGCPLKAVPGAAVVVGVDIVDPPKEAIAASMLLLNGTPMTGDPIVGTLEVPVSKLLSRVISMRGVDVGFTVEVIIGRDPADDAALVSA